VVKDLAVSYSIAFHATQYLPVTLFGLYLLWRTNLSWREIEKSEERIEEQLVKEEQELAHEERLAGPAGERAGRPTAGGAALGDGP